ncbi:YgzB family protein [Melghirimyces algeriensis]|uniref:Zinc-ribbon containing domain-containing protein n=1 Tax=Melghirimyces algeriensis TaxID=910412 RepID=A0A521DWT1_9BACL|nr:YgzB family protein [Melghirimyces algeriensis]SMO75330.1 Zinc-ribbon containing domain-containing protein [Melghirimyces algeriensis]
MLFAGKINKFRTVALLMIFIGMGIMYLGFLWREAMAVFFILGLLGVGSSVAIYFWVGVLSTQAVQVECPECNRATKMLGKMDECMFCKARLTLDPEQAGTDHPKK